MSSLRTGRPVERSICHRLMENGRWLERYPRLGAGQLGGRRLGGILLGGLWLELRRLDS